MKTHLMIDITRLKSFKILKCQLSTFSICFLCNITCKKNDSQRYVYVYKRIACMLIYLSIIPEYCIYNMYNNIVLL